MSTNLPAVAVPYSEVERMGERIAKSALFGVKTADQAIALMLVAQAEGRHPAVAAMDYDIIQGRPAKKAEAMMRDFLRGGGKIEWHALSDTEAAATFTHPQGGSARIDWDMKRAGNAGLTGKDNWRKFPRAMLRSRVVSEGIRTIYPIATSGMYVPEEVADFGEPRRPLRDVTPRREARSKPADDLADFAGDPNPASEAGNQQGGGVANNGTADAGHDPETGEVRDPDPVALDVPPSDAADKAWRTYAALLRNAAAAAPSRAWLDDWQAANQDGMVALEERSKIAAKAVADAINGRLAELPQ